MLEDVQYGGSIYKVVEALIFFICSQCIGGPFKTNKSCPWNLSLMDITPASATVSSSYAHITTLSFLRIHCFITPVLTSSATALSPMVFYYSLPVLIMMSIMSLISYSLPIMSTWPDDGLKRNYILVVTKQPTSPSASRPLCFHLCEHALLRPLYRHLGRCCGRE